MCTYSDYNHTPRISLPIEIRHIISLYNVNGSHIKVKILHKFYAIYNSLL